MKISKIQLISSISILPSLALKRLNFPENLDFKGKIVTKFLLRSHFLSICKNMTVRLYINHGAIQRVCHLHNGIFHSINLCHTFLILFYIILVLCTKNNMERFFVYMAASAYHEISKKAENCVLRYNCIFRCTSIYTQPMLTK